MIGIPRQSSKESGEDAALSLLLGLMFVTSAAAQSWTRTNIATISSDSETTTSALARMSTAGWAGSETGIVTDNKIIHRGKYSDIFFADVHQFEPVHPIDDFNPIGFRRKSTLSGAAIIAMWFISFITAITNVLSPSQIAVTCMTAPSAHV